MPIREDLIPILEALIARIIPADQDPGARELGAVRSIQTRIEAEPDLQSTYEVGLQNLLDKDFLNRIEVEQIELVHTIENEMPEFLSLVTTHCMEVVYVHPEGLRMVGFEVTA